MSDRRPDDKFNHIVHAHRRPAGNVERALTDFLALSANDARSSLVVRRLPRSSSARGLRAELVRRTRAVAARGGSAVYQIGRREGEPGRRHSQSDRRARRVRRRLSAQGGGARREPNARLRGRTSSARCGPQGASTYSRPPIAVSPSASAGYPPDTPFSVNPSYPPTPGCPPIRTSDRPRRAFRPRPRRACGAGGLRQSQASLCRSRPPVSNPPASMSPARMGRRCRAKEVDGRMRRRARHIRRVRHIRQREDIHLPRVRPRRSNGGRSIRPFVSAALSGQWRARADCRRHAIGR